MVAAIEAHDALKDDAEAKEHLKKYFTYTAHYIVAAMEYMRPDQVSFCVCCSRVLLFCLVPVLPLSVMFTFSVFLNDETVEWRNSD